MRRWHLTVFLALLAAAGIAMATTLTYGPVRVLGRAAVRSEPAPIAAPSVEPIPTAPVVVEPVAVVEAVPPAPLPEVAVEPPRPPRPPLPAQDPGVHPIHVDQGLSAGGIPELAEPQRPIRPAPPVIQVLPPDPPTIPDGCPACGMG